VLLYGNKAIKANDFETLFKKLLGKNWEIQSPIATYSGKFKLQSGGKIKGGPWDGRDTTHTGPFLTAFKFNIHKLTGLVSDSDLAQLRKDYRSILIPLLNKLGINSEYIGARIYGNAFDTSVDKGLPKLPEIPPEPKKYKWLLWLAGGVSGILVLRKVFK
jgi:hypothetical protein